MLGNTANGLFWTYRLLERAENMSRLIETGQRIALTRLNSSDKQWLYVMQTAAVSAEYKKYYNELIKNEIIFFDPVKAGKFINLNLTIINDWWFEKKRQKSIKYFCP